MNNNLVKVTLHGQLGEAVGAKDWDLAVSSVSQAIRAIEMNTKKLYKHLLEKDKENIKYDVVINGRTFVPEKKLDINDPKTILESELMIKNKNLRTLDIVPVFEGDDSKVLGIILIIVGIILIIVSWGSSSKLVALGIMLVAAGAFSLLARPPPFGDFREIEQGGKTSYLFSGPANVTGEGGPVPLGYGELIVGSQVISAAYVTRDFSTQDTSFYLTNEYGKLLITPPEFRPYTRGGARI